MYLFGSLGVLLVIAVGARGILSGAMQLGDLGAFLVLASFLYEPIGKLHELNQLVQAGRASGERVFECSNQQVNPEGGKTFSRQCAARLSSGTLISAIPANCRRSVTFHFTHGQVRQSRVGATGSGKSAVINLLARFYEADSGEILSMKVRFVISAFTSYGERSEW